MILVIDAYNVLKQVVQQKISEKDRARFIEQLGSYSKQKGHKIVVVFDAGPYERPDVQRTHGIYVVYSGIHETADEYIKRYLKQHKGLDLLLISSDRELCSSASHLGVPSLEVFEFYRLLQESRKSLNLASTSKQNVVKISPLEQPELDQIMEEASKQVPSSYEEKISESETRKSPSHRLSKKERQMLKKVKKL